MTSWTLRGRSATRVPGDVFTDFEATLVESFNRPDTLQVTGRTGHLRGLLTAGGGCTLEDETGVRFSGVLTQLSKSGAGTCSATFTSDLILLWDRLCYPTPTAAFDSQSADYDVRTGTAESVALGFLNANAGPAAIAARRIPGLASAVTLGRGPTVKVSARFDNLGQIIADLFETAGLRIRLVPDGGTGLTVEVTVAPNASAWARYGTTDSGGPGQVSDDWSLSIAAPDATRAMVAGGGEGAARILRERSDATSEADWGRRVEAFVDQRNTTDLPELDKSGDDKLAESSKPVDIRGGTVDSPGLVLGSDVPLGSIVGLDLDGDFLTDRLRQVTTTIDAGGVKVSGVVGSPDAGLPRDLKQFLKLHKAIRKVQSR